MLDHPVAQWAVRHPDWVQNLLAKSDVGLSGGGTTPHEAHTGGQSAEQCGWILGASSHARQNQR